MEKSLLTSKSEHWCTPIEFIEVVEKLGNIGLDPCSNSQSVVPAQTKYTITDDGLAQSWAAKGLVYCNPPYGRTISAWISKANQEATLGTEIIMLVPARPDTRWFHDLIIPNANAVCFVKGRIKFIDGTAAADEEVTSNSAPFPSLVAFWSPDPARVQQFMKVFSEIGWCVKLR